jgi:hypothetical protein
MHPHHCRQFAAFMVGPSEYYARSVLPLAPPLPRPVEEPTAPARRPRHFVRCMPAVQPTLANLG